MSRPSLASEVRAQLAALGELFRAGRRERFHNGRPDGREYPDPTPVELPMGYEAPLTMREMMQRYIRDELSLQAARADLGTFEEENDFEPEDPEEIQLSGYEVHEFEFVEEPGSPLRDDPEFLPADPSGAGQAPPGPPEAAAAPAEPASTEPPPRPEASQ